MYGTNIAKEEGRGETCMARMTRMREGKRRETCVATYRAASVASLQRIARMRRGGEKHVWHEWREWGK